MIVEVDVKSGLEAEFLEWRPKLVYRIAVDGVLVRFVKLFTYSRFRILFFFFFFQIPFTYSNADSISRFLI